MSAAEWLWLVFVSMPAAVLIDLVFFTFGIVGVRRWQEKRR